MTTVAVAVAVGFLVGPWLRASIVAVRLPPSDPSRGHCPGCSRRLLEPDPSTFASTALLGRCHACRQRIATPPAFIEAVSAAVLGLLALRVHPPLVLVAVGLAAAAGIVVAAVDARTRRVPDRVLIPTLVAVTTLLVAAGVVDHRPERLLTALGGASAAFAGYSLLALVTSGLGLGDCKLAALIGLVLGWVGWSALFAGITLGFALAALFVLPRIVTGGFSRTRTIAFGPFMLLGALGALLIAA